jgi:hypothetical protein
LIGVHQKRNEFEWNGRGFGIFGGVSKSWEGDRRREGDGDGDGEEKWELVEEAAK